MTTNALAQLLREHWAAQDRRLLEAGFTEVIEGHGVACVCESCFPIRTAWKPPSPPKHDVYRLTAELARLERRIKDLERPHKPHQTRQDGQERPATQKAAPKTEGVDELRVVKER